MKSRQLSIDILKKTRLRKRIHWDVQRTANRMRATKFVAWIEKPFTVRWPLTGSHYLHERLLFLPAKVFCI